MYDRRVPYGGRRPPPPRRNGRLRSRGRGRGRRGSRRGRESPGRLRASKREVEGHAARIRARDKQRALSARILTGAAGAADAHHLADEARAAHDVAQQRDPARPEAAEAGTAGAAVEAMRALTHDAPERGRGAHMRVAQSRRLDIDYLSLRDACALASQARRFRAPKSWHFAPISRFGPVDLLARQAGGTRALRLLQVSLPVPRRCATAI